jgi:hypothetical protein
MGLHAGDFGMPALVQKRAAEAEQIFQGYAKAKPRKEDSYAAARAFVRGQALDAWQRDLIAPALAEPIREQAGAMALGAKGFADLLSSYEKEVERGELWRLTWHGLLYSYFNFDLEDGKDAATQAGWEALRAFLERTWPAIDAQAGTQLVPDWIRVLRSEAQVLTDKPLEPYAGAYLEGDTEPTDRLAADLGIPPSSWFWHALVLAAVRSATAEGDSRFRSSIAQLVKLIEGKPGFRDDALEEILVRYHACKGSPPDERLRDFVCQPAVWKNPKLKSAGIATAWNRVPDSVWKMVLSWVNERNLKDFFDILAARNNADDRRLAFWSKYLQQIKWTRLVFGADTMALKRSNAAVRELIAREDGAYAQLTSKPEVDAFMMQLGSYLVIEFSKKPNACYVYQADQLPFEPYSRYYDGGTTDLAAGYPDKCALRIVHRQAWDQRAEYDLRQLGIHPDRPVAPHSQGTDAHERAEGARAAANRVASSGSAPDMAALDALLSRFRGASKSDARDSSRGRLWVEDPLQRAQLASELKSLGFRWADKRQAWYYPER